jgi:hypothetical protein
MNLREQSDILLRRSDAPTRLGHFHGFSAGVEMLKGIYFLGGILQDFENQF